MEVKTMITEHYQPQCGESVVQFPLKQLNGEGSTLTKSS